MYVDIVISNVFNLNKHFFFLSFSYAPPRCRTLQYRRTFISFSSSLLTILLTPYSIVWNWRVSRAGQMLLYWPKLLYPYYSLLLSFPFSYFCLLVGIVGLGSSD